MKKFMVIILSLIILSMTMLSGAVLALKGDTDGDGDVTVSDALAAMRIAAGLSPYDVNADTDEDGEVTAADALQILRCSVGFIKPDGIGGLAEVDVRLTQAATNAGLTQDMLDRGMVSVGDTSRMVRVMRKAQRGEEITVAFIGGSVTVGAAATTAEARYTRIVYNWWNNAFPDTKINYVNAGKSGTPSLFGVHRMENDLLRHEPDFVVIEFGVNDELQDWQAEAFASLVRRVLESDTAPAVMLFFVMNNGGTNAQADQVLIGNHYNLPMVSYRDAVWPEVAAGRMSWTDISSDWVHPTNAGHAMCGQLINCYLQEVLDKLDGLSEEVPPIPAPPRAYTYEHTKLYNNDNTVPVSLGSFTVYGGDFPWKAEGSGSDPLVIRFYGKRLILPISQPQSATVKASVCIDGGTPVMLDDDSLLISSGICAYYFIYDSDEPAWHTAEIMLIDGALSCGGLFVSW